MIQSMTFFNKIKPEIHAHEVRSSGLDRGPLYDKLSVEPHLGRDRLVEGGVHAPIG